MIKRIALFIFRKSSLRGFPTNRDKLCQSRHCEARSNLINQNRLLCWVRTQSRNDVSIYRNGLLFIFLFSCFASNIDAQQKTEPIQIKDNKDASFMELWNGNLGVIIPKQSAFQKLSAKEIPAPVQAVIYKDGTVSGTLNNYLQSSVPPYDVKVQIIKNAGIEAIVSITYLFHKPLYLFHQGTYKGGDAGKGYYTSTITLQQGAKSVVIDEASDFDISYQFKISNGLNPNRARYRGWSASSVENGYEPSGAVYFSEDKKTVPTDATVDLVNEKPRAFPFLSLWDAAGGENNTGRYWQVYNKDAAADANLFGFFQGKASKLLGAKTVGPKLIVQSSESNAGADKKLSAWIRLIVERRGPDNSWYPKKKFQWCLFVSTMTDLLPANQYQPIGIEMNRVSGLATKVEDYAKRKLAVTASFYDGAIYMSKQKMQELISRAKGDDGFYKKLLRIDYKFKPIADAWRFPDSARSSIKELIQYRKLLQQVYITGNGVHDFDAQYWRGSHTFQMKALQVSCLFADKSIEITSAEKDSLLQLVQLMARVEWDNDNVPFYDSAGINFGPSNMVYQYQNNGRNFFAMLFAKDPEFKQRAADIAAHVKADIQSAINENGSTSGSPHYTQATIDPILFTMLQLQQANVIDFFKQQKEQLKKFIDFYTSLLTPPSVRFSGNRKLISFGDGSEESAVSFGLLASGFAGTDSVLANQLNSVFQHGPERSSFFGYLALAVNLTHDYNVALSLSSSNYTGYVSHLRSGVNTSNETAAWVINGNSYNDHRNNDNGELAIYALKAPLSLSRSCFYYPRANDERIRSMVLPASTFMEWNKKNQPVTSPLSYGIWLSSEQLEFCKFEHSTVSFSKMANEKQAWYRKLVEIHILDNQPIFLIYDSVNNKEDNIWSFMSMSDSIVQTPAGKVLPINKINAWNNPALQELPEASEEKIIPGGLQKFSFTGQVWSNQLHPSGGINWDIYTLSNQPTSFTISQWTNDWQNSLETAEFLATNKKVYAETQQILRVKSGAPFYHLLLPYFKNILPYKNAVTKYGNNIVSIKYNKGRLLISPAYYFYNDDSTTIMTSFDSTESIMNGFSIDGGSCELHVNENKLNIKVHGKTGMRIIQVPFIVKAIIGKNGNVSIKQSRNNSQIMINYANSKMDVLSTEQGYSEYNFTLIKP